MTKKEALQAMFPFEVEESIMDKIFVDRDIVSTDPYSAEHKKDIELCAADLCFVLMTTPPSLSEGGLSVQYDRKALSDMRYEILNRYGLLSGSLPVIESESIW